ncbi:MAG: phenylacetate--CoA ligase, partial [Lentisphaeria bacterium]|nr:phenylacetate--CoA ligase [Lentisphaeria bacterium]
MSSIYWQEDIETLPRPQLAQLQLKKLRESITRALRSPFYGKLYRELNISAESIKTYDDVRKLPITTKDDLRACYPFELLTCPKDNVIRMHCTSGTTGNPAAVLY